MFAVLFPLIVQDGIWLPKSVQQDFMVYWDHVFSCKVHQPGVIGQNSGSSDGLVLKSEQHSGLDITFPDLISWLQNPPILHVTVFTGVDIFTFLKIEL